MKLHLESAIPGLHIQPVIVKLLMLLQEMDTKAVRSEVIARIPGLTSYNSTQISQDERERAERDFVRHFGQLDPEKRPQRYYYYYYFLIQS